MNVDRETSFPKGTYEVLLNKYNGSTEYIVKNLQTGSQCSGCSVWSFIKGIENDLSETKFPLRDTRYRSWGNVVPMKGSVKISDVDDEQPTGEERKQSVNRPSFIIQVLYRQNATWQGTIQWLEGKQTRAYRSTNELLILMDEVIELT